MEELLKVYIEETQGIDDLDYISWQQWITDIQSENQMGDIVYEVEFIHTDEGYTTFKVELSELLGFMWGKVND